jgi:cyclic pyranopterin phosphate synthase
VADRTNLGALPGLDNLVITTNGSQLDRFAQQLKAAGVKRINISLDTLKADRFKAITRIGDCSKVFNGIRSSAGGGLQADKTQCRDDARHQRRRICRSGPVRGR